MYPTCTVPTRLALSYRANLYWPYGYRTVLSSGYIFETTAPKPYVLHTREVRYDRPNAGGAGDPGDETLVGFYGTQALPRHPLRAVYLILFNLNIKYKLAFDRILQNLLFCERIPTSGSGSYSCRVSRDFFENTTTKIILSSSWQPSTQECNR